MESIIAGPRQTLADKGFYWREKGLLKLLVCDALESAGFANGFSTRIGGVSPMPENDLNLAGFDDDSAENIEENRQRFMTLFRDSYVLATAWQEHSDGVKVVDSTEAALRSDERYDALTSNLAGVLVGVKTADCVPILLGDKNRGAYAAIHAGWRGTASRIVEKAITSMGNSFKSEPADIVAAIGPAACGRNYEIGDEVIRIFEDNFDTADSYLSETRPGHALIDLHAANRDQLISAGVDPANIYVSSLCTMERTDLFFSYRREKARFGKTGRLLSVIGRLSGPSANAG